MSGFNTYTGGGYIFPNGLTIEGEYRWANSFVKTGEADYFGSRGNYSKFVGGALSIGKTSSGANGFANVTLGAIYGRVSHGEGSRVFYIPSGYSAKIKNSQELGVQLSARQVMKVTKGFGFELRESYNYSRNFSGLQVSCGFVLGNL